MYRFHILQLLHLHARVHDGDGDVLLHVHAHVHGGDVLHVHHRHRRRHNLLLRDGALFHQSTATYFNPT